MNLLKKAFVSSISRTVLPGSDKRFIFLYHDISDPGAPQYWKHYSTHVETFRQQIELLAKHFKMVSIEEVVSENSNGGGGGRLASVTFDDGFLSVREEAFPLLWAKGIPFTVFVNSTAVKHNRLSNGPAESPVERAGNSKVFLDENDIKYLDEKGVIIGSHTSAHKILSECDDAELKSEVLENKLYLEGLLGKKVEHLALPFGKREHYNEHVLEVCRRAGHNYIYSTNPTYFNSAPQPQCRTPIPRIPFLNESKEEMLFYINRPLFKTIDI